MVDVSEITPHPRREMEQRLKAFAPRVLEMTKRLPDDYRGRALGSQVFRNATSVAANYRAAGRARSKAEFIAKLDIVLEEVDETCFWLEMIEDSRLFKQTQLQPLRDEGAQITAILSTSIRSAKRNSK